MGSCGAIRYIYLKKKCSTVPSKANTQSACVVDMSDCTLIVKMVFVAPTAGLSRHEVDADGKPVNVKGFVTTGGRGGKETYREFDVVVAATDVPGIKKLLPESFRK